MQVAILTTSIKLLMKGSDFLAVLFGSKIGGTSSFEPFLKKKPGVTRVSGVIDTWELTVCPKNSGFCHDADRTRLQNGSTRLLYCSTRLLYVGGFNCEF